MKLFCKSAALGFVCLLLIAEFVQGKEELDLFQKEKWQLNLGREFPGATGIFTVAKEDEKNTGKLHFDFKDGGLYVAGVSTVNMAKGFGELRLQVKSSFPQTVLLRLVDGSNQMHQYKLPYTDSGKWQTLRVDLKEKSPQAFGGGEDRILHFPVKQLWLGVEKGGSEKEGDIFFSELKFLD